MRFRASLSRSGLLLALFRLLTCGFRLLQPCSFRGGVGGGSCRLAAIGVVRRPEQPRGAPSAYQHERRVAPGPGTSLRAQGQCRLDHERIADQRQQRAHVRQRIQPIRRATRMRVAKPLLQQGARRRQHEVGGADRHGQQRHDPPRRRLVARGLPRFRGHDRQYRQHGQRAEQQEQVDAGLRAGPQPVAGGVGIGVTGQQQHLEEQHATGPHRRRAAKPRQDISAQQRLYQK